MIQLNLLPDVKQEYIKAERSRRLVISVSVIITIASVAILILLLGVSGLQKKNINDLTSDIKDNTKSLQQTPQIDKILTVQNQLKSLTDLHDQKPAASRLTNYLNQVTPTEVDITNITIDFTQQTVTMTGTASALSSVNKYVDTLKFTKFSVDKEKASNFAFHDVVLGSFGLGPTTAANPHPATYSITFSYDPTIFDITQNVKLHVPNATTTRSSVDQPNEDLFQQSKAPVAKPAGGN